MKQAVVSQITGRVKSAYGPRSSSGRHLSPVSEAYNVKEYLYTPLDEMLVHPRVTPPGIKFASTNL